MDRRAPSRVDPVLRTLSAAVGGPAGERSAGHPWWTAGRVLLALTTVTMLAGMTGRSACVRRGWSGEQPFAELCWTELAGTSASRTGPGEPAAYVAGLAERLGGVLAPGAPTGLAAAAVLAVVLACVVLAVTRRLATEAAGPWAVAGWAAAPVLAAHWLSWDLLVAAGLVLVLLARVHRRPVLGLLGAVLAGAFGYPLVDTRTVDTGSVWLLLEQADGSGPGILLRSVVLVAALLGSVAAAYAVARAPARDVAGDARAGLLVVGTLLLVGPSAPPEAALLLLPLAALAVPRWRDLLMWQACELLAWVLTGWHLGGALVPSTGGESRMSWVAVLLRVAGVLWLLVAAYRAGSGVESAHQHAVERGRGEAHPHVDLVADAGHPRA